MIYQNKIYLYNTILVVFDTGYADSKFAHIAEHLFLEQLVEKNTIFNHLQNLGCDVVQSVETKQTFFKISFLPKHTKRVLFLLDQAVSNNFNYSDKKFKQEAAILAEEERVDTCVEKNFFTEAAETVSRLWNLKLQPSLTSIKLKDQAVVQEFMVRNYTQPSISFVGPPGDTDVIENFIQSCGCKVPIAESEDVAIDRQKPTPIYIPNDIDDGLFVLCVLLPLNTVTNEYMLPLLHEYTEQQLRQGPAAVYDVSIDEMRITKRVHLYRIEGSCQTGKLSLVIKSLQAVSGDLAKYLPAVTDTVALANIMQLQSPKLTVDLLADDMYVDADSDAKHKGPTKLELQQWLKSGKWFLAHN
jgi:hypothetical protein